MFDDFDIQIQCEELFFETYEEYKEYYEEN